MLESLWFIDQCNFKGEDMICCCIMKELSLRIHVYVVKFTLNWHMSYLLYTHFWMHSWPVQVSQLASLATFLSQTKSNKVLHWSQLQSIRASLGEVVNSVCDLLQKQIPGKNLLSPEWRWILEGYLGQVKWLFCSSSFWEVNESVFWWVGQWKRTFTALYLDFTTESSSKNWQDAGPPLRG